MMGYIDEVGHLSEWTQASVLHKDLDKRTRKSVEAARITTHANINNKAGSFSWAKTAAEIMVRDWSAR